MILTTFKAVALMAMTVPMAFSAPASTTRSEGNIQLEHGLIGKQVVAPHYCIPAKQGKFIPHFDYIDFSHWSLPNNFGNCCISFTTNKKFKALSYTDVKELEDLIRNVGSHGYGSETRGLWELESQSSGSKAPAPPGVVEKWALAVQHLAEERHVLKRTGMIGSAIFQRGNASVGEEVLVIKRKRSYD